MIGEYGAEIIYVKGHQNVVADALSRLHMQSSSQDKMAVNEKLFFQKRILEDQVFFYLDLYKIESIDKTIINSPGYRKGGKRFKTTDHKGHDLWTYEGIFFVSNNVRAPMVEWYHENLQHPGPERTV